MLKSEQTFTNQALNTLYNYPVKGHKFYIKIAWIFKIRNINLNYKNIVKLKDSRDINIYMNMWITDPPYADAVNYHELSEFFLAWDKKTIENSFKEWYIDSKRVLAVKV